MENNVVILTFSPRNGGNCAKIAEFINNYHKSDNVSVFAITADNFSACRDCNYECLQPGMICPQRTHYQLQVMDSIVNADMVYYILPNFCGQPNANYFVFNERSVDYFNLDRALMNKYLAVRKQFIIVSNTESETFYNAAQQQTSGKPEMLYLKTSKYGKRSTNGDIMDSEAAKADLEAFLSI